MFCGRTWIRRAVDLRQRTIPTGTITFAQTLSGETVLGVHFGDGGTGLGDRTQFYRLNFTSTGDQLTLNTRGFSDGVIINPGLPEPSTWAMMLIGFGAVGFGLRRRKGEGKPARIRLAYS